MGQVKYPLHSLEDFLISTFATVDGQLDDGWGASFPVKGREIDATILFADISGFSRRTLELSSTETLIFANHFFTWASAEALRDGHGIVDKYVGDEMMVVFSKQFGSENTFAEAIIAGRRMSERDFFGFAPHIGIASGQVTVGYVGTPIKYNCSVFGRPVVLAARCANIRPSPGQSGTYSGLILCPEIEWKEHSFQALFPPRKTPCRDGGTKEEPSTWEALSPRRVPLEDNTELEVREILNRALHFATPSAAERAKQSLQELRRAGRYWPSDERH